MPWTMLLGFAKRFWPYLAGVAALAVAYFYFHHAWYQEGYEEAQAEYQAAAIQAGRKFAEELAARDEALAAAQGQVVEVVKWRTRTQTIYEEAVKNDPDCQAWAAAPVGCPLGLPIGPDDRADLPADSGEPDG